MTHCPSRRCSFLSSEALAGLNLDTRHKRTSRKALENITQEQISASRRTLRSLQVRMRCLRRRIIRIGPQTRQTVLVVIILFLVAAQGYLSFYFATNPPQVLDFTGSFNHVVKPTYNHTFPRWGPEGIDLRTLLEFIQGLPNKTATTLPEKNRFSSEYLEFPEIPYIFDKDGVWVSTVIRNRTVKHQIRYRVLPSEEAMHRAWNRLMKPYDEKDTTTAHLWPNLQRAIAQGGGFPMIVWHGDFRGCNLHNYKRVSSIPLFTTCAHVKCTHTFPFPSYKTIADSLNGERDWDAVFYNQSTHYPWKSKIRKLVWRGSLSGPLLNHTSPRYRIGAFAARHRDHPLLDIGIHRIPLRHYYKNNENKTKGNLTLIKEHLLPGMPQLQFGKYIAILDTDGNSWSSRYGGLLCRNSLILKVEPHYVDYFYKYLQPFTHYVPVRYDLSDLLAKVEWVMNSDNDVVVQKIVANANQWCQRHMNHEAIAEDMLDILNIYVGYLDLHSGSWVDLWNASKPKFFVPEFGMKKLSQRVRRKKLSQRVRRKKPRRN